MPAYRLAAAARRDILDLLEHTHRTFGAPVRRRYEALLVRAIRDVAADPRRIGSVARPELGDGVYTYHLRHSRARARTPDGIVRKPRHILLYRFVPDADLIDIGRVLHDAMEPERHLPDDFAEA